MPRQHVPICGFTAVLLHVDNDYDRYIELMRQYPDMTCGLIMRNCIGTENETGPYSLWRILICI